MILSTSAGGGLLLQRFPQLVQQARVLDGNDGLIGKILEQRDLPFGKGLDPRPANHKNAYDGVVPEHRDCEDRPMHLLVSPVILAQR